MACCLNERKTLAARYTAPTSSPWTLPARSLATRSKASGETRTFSCSLPAHATSFCLKRARCNAMNSKLLRAISFRKRPIPSSSSFFRTLTATSGLSPAAITYPSASAAAWLLTIRPNFAHICKLSSENKNFPPKPLASTVTCCHRRKFRLFRSARLSAKIGHLLGMLPLSLTHSPVKVFSTPCARANFSAKPLPKAIPRCTPIGFSPLLSWLVPRHRGHHAHGSISAPQHDLPPDHGRYFQRHAGLHDAQATRCGTSRHDAERFRYLGFECGYTGHRQAAPGQRHRPLIRVSGFVLTNPELKDVSGLVYTICFGEFAWTLQIISPSKMASACAEPDCRVSTLLAMWSSASH